MMMPYPNKVKQMEKTKQESDGKNACSAENDHVSNATLHNLAQLVAGGCWNLLEVAGYLEVAGVAGGCWILFGGW